MISWNWFNGLDADGNMVTQRHDNPLWKAFVIVHDEYIQAFQRYLATGMVSGRQKDEVDGIRDAYLYMLEMVKKEGLISTDNWRKGEKEKANQTELRPR